MTTPTETFSPPTGRVVGADLFRTDGARAGLRVTRCRDCASAWFPALAQCASCASLDVADELSSSTGTTYASTVVQIGPARFEPPYVVAYVDVDDVRVLAHVRGDTALPPGTPVELRVGQIGADENGPLWSYTVVPTSEATSNRGESR
jgi:uncharacterized OB-fold protein